MIDAMIKDIEEFLYNEKEESSFIKQLSEKYCLNDFVMVDNDIKTYLKEKGESAFVEAYGGIFDYREKQICFYDDKVVDRLAEDYNDFLWKLLESDERDKVKFIIAYHYLAMLKQIAFNLDSINQEILFSEQYAEKIKAINSKYGRNHHAIKHYSLIEYLLNHEEVNRCEIELIDEFKLMLNAFLFQYKFIFSTEMIFPIMFGSKRLKVIESLVYLE